MCPTAPFYATHSPLSFRRLAGARHPLSAIALCRKSAPILSLQIRSVLSLAGSELSAPQHQSDWFRKEEFKLRVRIDGDRIENQGKCKAMHGRRGSTTTTVAVDSKSSANSFYKDVRKIGVGDCAFFKPAHDFPAFIGIIRCLVSDRESILKLGVNWLYRPAEIKLGKGVAFEAAPNEILYSFHRDEIPVAPLLHPCRVAFSPKGVELPPRVSSFVCWRVYDITNNCLWWLTDQDYIND
ncbi:hypothetical protein Ancab_035748 [Ancistrocladus abbreviatus]